MTRSFDLIDGKPSGRKLVAVLFADMVDYSRLLGLDDLGTVGRLRTLRHRLIDPTISEHGGRIVSTAGDSLFVAFDSIDGAVRCAVVIQQQIPSYDGDHPLNDAIRFRVSINIADVIADGTNLHGDGVNVAARLQAECPPGGICVSRAIRDHVHDRLAFVFKELGRLTLKNIARPVEAFLLLPEPNITEALQALPAIGVNPEPLRHYSAQYGRRSTAKTLPRLELLGGITLRTASGVPVALPLQAQALVAVLALQGGRPVKQEVLSHWLWAEQGEKRLRHNLNEALGVLCRDGFGDENIIVTRNDALSLPQGQIACDVHDLRAMLQLGTQVRWQAITHLYVGPLLAGFPSVSQEFNEFLDSMRRTLEADVLDALRRLADNTNHRDTVQRIAIAEQMWAIDPLCEDTHRRLINSYAQANRTADAMRLYTEAKTRLRLELSVAPAAETNALIERIRDGAILKSAPSPVNMTVPAAPGYSGPPRIAVLPLRQFLGKTLKSHITDGITADIISQLAGLRELTVISHGSTIDLRDLHLDTREIGRKLDARYLVFGNIRQGGDSLRLTTELTEAETGRIIYARTDDAEATLSFADQDRIVGQVVNTLVPQVKETELRRIRGQRPELLSVYEKVLLSREHMMLLNRESFSAAKHLVDEVIQEDPGYGEAYALAADWHGISVGEGWSTDRSRDIAEVERLTHMALNIDSNNLRALVSYGYRRSLHYRDHVGAMRFFERALNIAPSSATAWALSGCCLAFAGDANEAVKRATRALELSPYDREAYKFFYTLCVAHYTGGDFEQAAHWGRRALAEKAVWRGAGGYTAASLAALGRWREAHEVAAENMAAWPGRRVSTIVAALPYDNAERREQYRQHLCAAGFTD